MTLPGIADEVEPRPVVVACLGGGTVDEVAPLLEAVDVIRRSKVTIAYFALSISSCDSNTSFTSKRGRYSRFQPIRLSDLKALSGNRFVSYVCSVLSQTAFHSGVILYII